MLLKKGLQMNAHRIYKLRKVNPFVFGIMVIGVFFLSIWVLKGILRLLTMAAPVLLIGAAIVNYRVILGYGKWLLDTLRSNPLLGVAAIFLSIVGFPLVSAYLFFKAIRTKEQNVDYKKLKAKGDYTPYEEVEEDFLDLSDVKKQKKNIEEKYEGLI